MSPSLSPYEKCISAHLAATVKRKNPLSFDAIHSYDHFYSALYIIFISLFISRSYTHYLKICISSCICITHAIYNILFNFHNLLLFRIMSVYSQILINFIIQIKNV